MDTGAHRTSAIDGIVIEEILDHRHLPVGCWNCSQVHHLTMQWLVIHRDMNCVNCDALIILNTASLKAKIKHEKAQGRELERQLIVWLKCSIVWRLQKTETASAKHVFALSNYYPQSHGGIFFSGCSALRTSFPSVYPISRRARRERRARRVRRF